jgi:hypothetical protein
MAQKFDLNFAFRYLTFQHSTERTNKVHTLQKKILQPSHLCASIYDNDKEANKFRKELNFASYLNKRYSILSPN